MLAHSDVATRLPVHDLGRARAYYSDKLGLEPAEERPGGLRYHCGSGAFALFVSAGAAAGTHTQMSWEVADLEATRVETVDMPDSLGGISEGIERTDAGWSLGLLGITVQIDDETALRALDDPLEGEP